MTERGRETTDRGNGKKGMRVRSVRLKECGWESHQEREGGGEGVGGLGTGQWVALFE